MIKSLANWGDHVWIKQHLRIKRFLGTSENAVKTQVWIATAVYVLVAIIRKRMKGDASSTHCYRFSASPFLKKRQWINCFIFQNTMTSSTKTVAN